MKHKFIPDPLLHKRNFIPDLLLSLSRPKFIAHPIIHPKHLTQQ